MTRVAFVSFRLKGQDGVSIESEKWISVFKNWNYEVHRIAGFIPEPCETDHLIPELNHRDPRVEAFTMGAFSRNGDVDALRRELADLTHDIGERLIPALETISPDLLVVENVLSLPLNLPLAVVLSRFLEEEKMPCIAVHHDFYWQSPRFDQCLFNDILVSHFPPSLPQVRHVTINGHSREELYQKTGMTSACVYNCFDFDDVRRRDDFNAALRSDLGIGAGATMFLQPTRAIERKGIARSVRFVEEFAGEGGHAAVLVVTGPCEDGYESAFQQMCRGASVDVLHIPGWLGARRDQPIAGSRYEVRDAYARCDVVTFPSTSEGFGNPVLESVVHRKPLLVSNYPVLEELRGFGFQFLPLDSQAVSRAIKLLEHPLLMEEMLDRNFEIGRKHFSLESLAERMSELVTPAMVSLD